MSSLQTENGQMQDIGEKPMFDLLGVLIQFLVTPREAKDSLCLIRQIIRPGIVIPLHSHANPEMLYILDGSVEVFRAGDGWTMLGAGDVVGIAGDVEHALRNSCSLPVTLLGFTKSELYEFFRELAKPFDPDDSRDAPTPEAMSELFAACVKHHYWLASMQENATIGLTALQTAVSDGSMHSA